MGTLSSSAFPAPPSTLQVIQNSAARVLSRTRLRDHITPTLARLHWLPIPQRIKFKILTLTYKAIHGLAPSYLSDLLSPYLPARTLRSSGSGLLHIPRPNRPTIGVRAFSLSAPRLWNSIPQCLRRFLPFLLQGRSKTSMYHALGYSTMHAMQAAMTFEQQDILSAIATMKEALHTCQRYRKKNSVVESLSSLVSKQGTDQLTEEEMHAEMCYAECLLQKAALMLQIVEMTHNHVKTDVYSQFEGGVKLGIGAFNLMLSLLPSRILRLLEFIGFSGNREMGLSMLREGASVHSLRAVLCVLTLLMYQTYITVVLGSGEGNLVEAEALIEPYIEKYPNAQQKFEECIAAQQEWRQIHHLCYWELMWSYIFQQNWLKAYQYADLLCKESRWSQAIYVFQKAAILSMLPEEDVKRMGEDVEAIFRRVEGLKQRFAGKSIPTEKFAVRKARRYNSPNPVKLVLPSLEMMYVWNGFAILGKHAELTERMLITIEQAEAKLNKVQNPTEYQVDDECLVQLLKGLCLKYLHRPLQAELCFNRVVQSERRIRYDHYLVPFTLYEMGLLYKQEGDWNKARRFIETAR
uniref:Tetratricopeptide repeat protein 39B n=1 Tax=Callorhinchus milii TaxID=7868 RepID=A0A4W3JUK4_CALMI